MYGVTGVETSWRLCFLVEYLAFELGQAFPGHLSHPELAAAALPGPSSSCGQGRKELPAGGTTLEQLLQHQALALWELQSSAEQWEILQGWELSPGECADCCCLQSCSRSGMRGALACSPGAGQHWGAALTPQRRLRGVPRTEHCRLNSKSKVPRVLHSRLVLMIKGKLHPLCSAWVEF